ncbi:probable ATP-dependent RNA helicase DHX34 [Argonauta hians]
MSSSDESYDSHRHKHSKKQKKKSRDKNETRTKESHSESKHEKHRSKHKHSSKDIKKERYPDTTSSHLRSDYKHQSSTSDKSTSSVTSQRRRIYQYLDFKNNRHSLDKIFFGSESCIKRNSHSYTDFWSFLEKYLLFQQQNAKSSRTEASPPSDSVSEHLKISSVYKKSNKINLDFNNRSLKDFLFKKRLPDEDFNESFTEELVLEFKNILLHYLDFVQKQKFSKLKKLRQDQQNLPIWKYKENIINQIKANSVVLVAGDTGCGKSTQVPQYLIEAGFQRIACTQPRRISCISLSKRVSYETLNENGSEVAYQIRFEKTKRRDTKILFLTEGLLLRQMSTDMYLSMYDVILLDEVHERHIFTDFLLGMLKCVLVHREDLKVVLMSATINVGLFSSYFDNAPVVKVPGSLFPIQLEYHPIPVDMFDSQSSKLDCAPYLRIMQTIDHKFPHSERGDLLVFLSGINEIMALVEVAQLYAQQTKSWIILPLHSALSIEQQDKVFDIAPDGTRKCIISTNISETSVTIDGVRFIIDSGKVKEMHFDTKFKMKRLTEFWISRASAEQRKGRAGRTGPGICYRLYSEADYEGLEQYSTPEILRLPLDSLTLLMISLGLPDCRRFPFIEPPDATAIENSLLYLKEQEALNENETLTPIGEMLSKLPVDVVVGKMLIMGSIFHMVDPVLSIAAGLTVQSPFISKTRTDVEIEAARKYLLSDHGDPFSLLNAFNEWIQVKAKGERTKKWSKRRGLEEQRFYEMTKLKHQFNDILKDNNLLPKDSSERFYTSEERKDWFCKRKQLRQLRKEERDNSKKRKFLKFEDDTTMQQSSDEEEASALQDIKDLEFHVTQDLNKLQKRSHQSQSLEIWQINLLKIILTSGLYPKIAIADDCNSYKSESEQVFHTKNKGFLLLHPTSVFSSQPDLLQLPDNDVKMSAGQKGVMSSKHELLAFVSILETNKPYLMNVMRIPALQTVLLFGSSLDSNSTCTRIVCDGWLEISFADPDVAQHTVSSVLHLRAAWNNLLKLRLESSNKDMSGYQKLEKVLVKKLTEFLRSKVLYSIRRILTAELEHIYVGSNVIDHSLPSIFKSATECQPHPVKGGIMVNSFFVYNCLHDSSVANAWSQQTSHLQCHWRCPKCEQKFIISVIERLQHESSCGLADSSKDVDDSDEDENMSRNPLKQKFECSDCGKSFQFTASEILKHKRSHLIDAK